MTDFYSFAWSVEAGEKKVVFVVMASWRDETQGRPAGRPDDPTTGYFTAT
jgi:hypothetical protein